MADLTITVSDRDEPVFSPASENLTTPPRGYVRQGGSVEFVLASGSAPVNVTFPKGSPFSQTGPIQLGGPAQQSTQDKTVASQAPASSYSFVVTLQNPPPKHHGEDPEPPSTVSGDLEVTPDFPFPET
ncbi:hypothetical protein [Stigmatella aurantiaca]|uniref:Uncharacterized protein n=1 Tax=Stigmatella aurantiaca (strain DW4/3-1) TaxID=378806 RepID=Q097B2_STIAD|nr:hypothetical protein [Stigmatella aurantiaca]ADO76060.1 uncharacterized protein STAUR_8306 [Stigmatella aurantiaca DW4/3-1]EAU67808.1 hypothetical protein STIAU_3098 [Stigmatella aurantiaca DW4/3-1]